MYLLCGRCLHWHRLNNCMSFFFFLSLFRFLVLFSFCTLLRMHILSASCQDKPCERRRAVSFEVSRQRTLSNKQTATLVFTDSRSLWDVYPCMPFVINIICEKYTFESLSYGLWMNVRQRVFSSCRTFWTYRANHSIVLITISLDTRTQQQHKYFSC